MINGTVYLAAGGTGGHIFPALAVAEAMNAKGYTSVLFTDRRGEKLLTDMETLPVSLTVISAASPFQSGLPSRIFAIIKIAHGVLSCFLAYRYQKASNYDRFWRLCLICPAYCCRPIESASHDSHEQNAFLGRANHAIARRARLLALSWPQTKNLPDGVQTHVTGMPVRNAFFKKECQCCVNDKLVLTVLGGSQGAEILGTLVPDAIDMIETPLRSRIKVFQQARPEQISHLKTRYKTLEISASIKPFFKNMPGLLKKSDLVISRSGASSIAELAATGRASLMLPLPSAMDNHQKANATQMEQVGGGYCLDETTISPAFLATRIMQLFGEPDQLRAMARNAKALASPAAANDIADLAQELITERNANHHGGVV